MNQNITATSRVLVLPTREWLVTLAFIAGNIILPQICHLLPGGGPTWLPIYFFTLIGAWRYGFRVGLITAIASPIVNCVLFGMPSTAVVAPIIIKSILLALSASAVASRHIKPTLLLLLSVVLTYQVIGSLAEWVIYASFTTACQDFRIGVPGMLVQIFGAYALFRIFSKK